MSGAEKAGDLLFHLERLHTTPGGDVRIKKNLALDTGEVLEWCREKIAAPGAVITRTGKNWYVQIDGCTITVNVHSYTVITAHQNRRRVGEGEGRA
ncbi:DUF3781 domain-containing protein [Bittarella massiliensis]|uniref:DUF3781 domain-containing protein n=1 Tax=Bittarella massiliensis (ex Durand et al. 2017) TaxID=1720313 RepID=UPI00163D1394|nr:DUF3781 domain-containing protein [Bittarella massiliensis (ex Durand et al. 2017)]MBC2870204.1 DUF3781 domain-containing protein [Bittarella massiliensis (ex Durand et al. 2017)]